MKVPFVDLSVFHDQLRNEIEAAIAEVVDRNAFSGGAYVEKFEQSFSQFCNVKHVVGVGSGTDALWLALKAIDVGVGDEVITSPCSFFATAEAISQSGATPVFADVQSDTYNLDPTKLESSITSKTKAIIPVHLFGQMADMKSILEIANRYGLPVIEDAAQAHGAEFEGQMAGSMGSMGCFSFYPSKNLGAFGEAGAVATNDPELAIRLRQLRNHGQTDKYHHDLIGWNGRMDGIQAAILDLKLKWLESGNMARRESALLYNELLRLNREIGLPYCDSRSKHVYHIFAVQIENRDTIRNSMMNKGIECGIHYPIPLHLQEAYNSLNHKYGDFPIAENCSKNFLSLPMFPHITRQQIELVCETLVGQLY